jgi:hypothetical protein
VPSYRATGERLTDEVAVLELDSFPRSAATRCATSVPPFAVKRAVAAPATDQFSSPLPAFCGLLFWSRECTVWARAGYLPCLLVWLGVVFYRLRASPPSQPKESGVAYALGGCDRLTERKCIMKCLASSGVEECGSRG